MTLVAGKVRVNRPYFFKDVDGDRVEFPAFGTGQGDLDGADLSMFNMYVKARQIEATTAAVAPSNVVAPSISGVARVGETLTADTGEWDGDPAPTIEIQWQADGVNISGATATTYTPVEDDVGKVITAVVTATNSQGNASATSAGTAAVAPADEG